MDNQKLTDVLAFASVLAVFVLAGVQFIKTTISVPKNIIPLIGVVIGLVIGWAAAPFTDLELVLRLWSGALAGLSATGLFELAFNKSAGNTKE
ncbi:holin [Paenibacillus sp. HN-1]|uniref:holin n=1 Tax=Paenibacillus TaxID=44249 RepID=UPI001CA98E7E|nr:MULTISPECIES: holin [Paenibacillus]MBY9082396.1 holin [Paenibacillus sp. CGMCC 1.18879]MBY9085300.1 holin [Paenibacillus sinensis]